MPAVVKTRADEAKWERAKDIVAKQARKKKGKKPDDKWALTMHVYQGMKKSVPTGNLADLLACVRRAYELAHSFHWRTSGPLFAADHELFSKVYTQLYGYIDPLAEKIVGAGGTDLVEAAKQAKKTADEHSAAVNEPAKFPEEMLNVVRDLLDDIRGVIAENDDDGVENMLQGMVDEIQTLEYLLQQRASSPAQKSGLVLDLEKADIALLRARSAPGAEQRWGRFPGAASMFNQREYEETQRLMTTMPTPKAMISDGNFTSPDDVVKGLGFGPNDETIWAHRVARLVTRAPNELALRKALHEDLRQEALEPTLRLELNRRVLSLYRQSGGGKPLEKAMRPGTPPPPGMAPGGKPQAPGRGPSVPQDAAAGKPADPNAPAVDDADLENMPSDQALLRHKIHALHEQLKSAAGAISGNHAMIHMHNDLKAAMRDAYREPDPQLVADIDHKVHHFLKLVEGPQPIQADPNAPPIQPGAKPGAPPPPPGAGGQPPPKGPPQKGAPPPTAARVAKGGLVLDLAKADGGERPGHKYTRRIPKPGGGYEYVYDEPGGGRPGGAGAPAGAPGAPAPQASAKPTSPKPVSTMEVGGTKIHKFAPGQAPTPKNVDEKGRPKDRHWIDHHPDHPTFEQGGTAKKYGIDPATGIPSDPERAKLHDEIISKHFDHVPSVPAGQKPVAIVTMGGPASGKTSALKNLGFAGRNDFVAVDPDAVKTGEEHLGTKGLPEFHEAAGMGHLEDGTPVSAKSGAAVVHDESSHIADRLRDKAVGARKNVIIDGTGKNANKHVKLINDLKSRGYHVHLVMPHQTAENAKALNKGRAAATGRHVPESIVDEAYSKIPHNFEKVAAAADHATLFDATKGFPPKKVYEKHAEGETIHDEGFMTDFRAKHGPDKIQKSEVSVMPKKISNKRPPAIDPAKISSMIEDAFTKGARTEGGYAAAGSAEEGMDDSHAYEDTHLDIGLKRGSIKGGKSDD